LLFFRTQGTQCNRQATHTAAIASIHVIWRQFTFTRIPEVNDPAANGVTDISWLASHPVTECPGSSPGVNTTMQKNGIAQCQTHFGVIGNLAFNKAQPATADNVTMNTIAVFDFTGRHEFNGGAQRITDCQSGIGCPGAHHQVINVG
jgi:hypothetical protein